MLYPHSPRTEGSRARQSLLTATNWILIAILLKNRCEKQPSSSYMAAWVGRASVMLSPLCSPRFHPHSRPQKGALLTQLRTAPHYLHRQGCCYNCGPMPPWQTLPPLVAPPLCLKESDRHNARDTPSRRKVHPPGCRGRTGT